MATNLPPDYTTQRETLRKLHHTPQDLKPRKKKMKNGIEINVSNDFRKVLDFVGEHEWQNGKTTIEANTSNDGKDIFMYIQNKGFGAASSKSVRTHIDNQTAAELIVFLQRHLDLSAKAEAMRNAAE